MAPTIWLAPGLFSTRKGWPIDSCICCPSTRAKRSVTPPGGYGTMIFTGREGKGCAEARPESPMSSAMTRLPTFISVSLVRVRGSEPEHHLGNDIALDLVRAAVNRHLAQVQEA